MCVYSVHLSCGRSLSAKSSVPRLCGLLTIYVLTIIIRTYRYAATLHPPVGIDRTEYKSLRYTTGLMYYYYYYQYYYYLMRFALPKI